MVWSKDYKRSIDCDNPRGFSQRAHCAGRKKRAKGEDTKSKSPFNEMHEVKTHKTVEQIAKKHRLEVSFIQKQLDMGIPIEHEHTKDKDLATDIALQHLEEIPDYYTRLKKMEASAKKHHKKFKDVKENVTIEDSDGNTFAEIIDLVKPDPIKKEVKEDLRRWFSKDAPEGNWRRFNTKGEAIGPCAREPGEPKPKCLSNEKAAKMSKDEIAAAVRRKRESDPVANRRGKGGKPKMVSNKIQEAMMVRYCPKCKKDETRDECQYGQRYWDMFSLPVSLGKKYTPNTPHPGNFPESYDHEYSMARSELSTIISAAKRLKKKMKKGEGNIEAWVQSKITKAADYIDAAADYVDSGEMNENAANIARLALMAGTAAVGKAVYDKAKGVAGKIEAQNKEKENQIKQILGKEDVEFVGDNIMEKNVPTNPELWSRAKSLAKQKFDVYPSAYANGWASKWYKSKGGGWKTVSEDADPCWDTHKQVGMKKKGRRLVPDCVKKEEFSDWRKELLEDWQKVNRQDKTDGLSQAAVDAYRRENPGSKLQTAVTEKKPKGKRAKRRANFCRRMKGMKEKLTSKKTARDPDSRINRALRRWNCN